MELKVFFSWLSKIPCDFEGDYPTARHQDQSGALRIDLLIGFLHPGRWNLLINHLETKMIFQASMIMFHVNLPGCILFLVHSIELYIYMVFFIESTKKIWTDTNWRSIFESIDIYCISIIVILQERYNTPLEHTPDNPPRQLSKESLYGLLVEV